MLDDPGYIGSPELAAKEVELQELQKQLYHATNPSEIQALQAAAEKLAAELVTGRRSEVGAEEARTREERADIDEEIRQTLGEYWDKAVANIQESLSNEEIETFNDEILSNPNDYIRKAGADALKVVAENPDSITTERQAIDANQYSDLQERYGHSVANSINILSQAVARGVVSSTDAFKTASRDPAVMSALMQEALSGRMKMMM